MYCIQSFLFKKKGLSGVKFMEICEINNGSEDQSMFFIKVKRLPHLGSDS